MEQNTNKAPAERPGWLYQIEWGNDSKALRALQTALERLDEALCAKALQGLPPEFESKLAALKEVLDPFLGECNDQVYYQACEDEYTASQKIGSPFGAWAGNRPAYK